MSIFVIGKVINPFSHRLRFTMRSCRIPNCLVELVRPTYKGRGIASTAIGQMDINTKYKMRSGYEIPVLGYGVRIHV